MVPLVEAWKHVHIEDPIPENHLWPVILVIIFRLVILYVVLSAAAKLFTSRSGSTSRTDTPRHA